MDTIYALSSGHLPSGVAVVRLSGPQVQAIVQKITGQLPAPRYMQFGKLYSADKTVIDNALTVFFKAPASFTGEDCAEFHLHGGKAVVARLFLELSQFDHCRSAEAGEFSRRAFANGKLDLTEAEGLADLIEAETESQRRLAVMGASGKLANLYRTWRKRLIHGRAMIEAELDFSDEQDIPGAVSNQIWDDMASLESEIQNHIRGGESASLMREGLKIVIAGAPNSGKSSFINLLSDREIAIVTEEAGTTRDALEVRLTIEGFPVLLTDTAGLRQTDNRVEKLGIEKAMEKLQEADLVFLLEDMHHPLPVILPPLDVNIWLIGNKLDNGPGDLKRWPLQISAQTGDGFAAFMAQLKAFLADRVAEIGSIIPARQRQMDLLKQGCQQIAAALSCGRHDLELSAEHLRLASDALGRITGDIDVEDLLDVVFSEFCVGK